VVGESNISCCACLFSPRSGVVRNEDMDGSFSTAYTSPSPTTSAFWSLREDVAQLWVVFVFVDMVDTDVSGWISIGDNEMRCRIQL
jgi:hypothetical protein